MKSRIFVIIMLLTLSLILSPSPALAAPDYLGHWVRTGKTVNGAPRAAGPASLVLTATTFSQMVAGPPAEACAFTGTMTVANGRMTVQIQVSACPALVAGGSTRVYLYTVAGGQTLTTTLTQGQDNIVETYKREAPGSGPGTACPHPLCGAWNRVATYVNNELVHNEPAYTVFTAKTYNSIAAACFNTLSIDTVTANNLTMTMIVHNCPTPPGVMGPGTVVKQTYELSDGGQNLTLVNTEYGAAVKTVFQRVP